MHSISALFLACAISARAVTAQSELYYGHDFFHNTSSAVNQNDPFLKYNLTAAGISASFIAYGARLTNLIVSDRNGKPQDVAVGYDKGAQYANDTTTVHTYFGAVVGRYANRIKNGTFDLDGQTYHIPENENGGIDTLHSGGAGGYDVQNWTVAALTQNSITFTLYDDGLSGFPGSVLNVATYTLTDEPAFISRLVSIPLTQKTPIMLANHIYWNLGAYVDAEAQTILNNTLQMPYAKRFIDTDGILVPTGMINVTKGTPLDFTKSKAIGKDIADTLNVCGTGCVGYDNAFILDRPASAATLDSGLEVLRLYAPSTGIQMNLEANQQGAQIYTCNGLNGTIPVKASQQHGNSTTFIKKHGCIVVETQDWIDGVNNPSWGRDRFQIFSPEAEPAVNYQKYIFSVVR